MLAKNIFVFFKVNPLIHQSHARLNIRGFAQQSHGQASSSKFTDSSIDRSHGNKLDGSRITDDDLTRRQGVNAHRDIMEENFGDKHFGNVVGGYKATLSNPRTSDQARDHAEKKLNDLGVKHDSASRHERSLNMGEENADNVIGGHNATISNPHTSTEATQHSKKVLNNSVVENTHGREHDTTQHHRGGQGFVYDSASRSPYSSYRPTQETASHVRHDTPHSEILHMNQNDSHKITMGNTGNVIGGYKATISNPNTSDQAKEHARHVLDELEPHRPNHEPLKNSDNTGSSQHSGSVRSSHQGNETSANTPAHNDTSSHTPHIKNNMQSVSGARKFADDELDRSKEHVIGEDKRV